jgi:hypothetical protein
MNQENLIGMSVYVVEGLVDNEAVSLEIYAVKEAAEAAAQKLREQGLEANWFRQGIK